MKDYIRSKDYRKFMEENNVRLSDWDKATLIYNASGMSHTDKIFAWRKNYKGQGACALRDGKRTFKEIG